jgi:hypothetical protein
MGGLPHYFIKNGGVRWARDWTDEQIARGREADLSRKRRKLPDRVKEVEQKASVDLNGIATSRLVFCRLNTSEPS